MSTELLVIMPVFNEQVAVGKVVREWFPVLDAHVPNFVFLALNDGSTDGTLAALHALRAELGPRLEILDRPNRGHGQSCLQGYRVALERGVPHVFQIDSDGQCDPRFFAACWQRRARFDVIYGRRTRRDDGWARVLVSATERAFLLLLFGVNCVDANVPYRLLRTSPLASALARIPATFRLGNIALAVLLRKDPAVRHGSVPIRFRARDGGEPAVRLTGFALKALELYHQLRGLVRVPVMENMTSPVRD